MRQCVLVINACWMIGASTVHTLSFLDNPVCNCVLLLKICKYNNQLVCCMPGMVFVSQPYSCCVSEIHRHQRKTCKCVCVCVTHWSGSGLPVPGTEHSHTHRPPDTSHHWGSHSILGKKLLKSLTPVCLGNDSFNLLLMHLVSLYTLYLAHLPEEESLAV